MTPERWQQVKQVLHGALERAPEQRPAFLDNACAADHSLRQDVESLLASSDAARSGFLRSSAARVTLAKGTRLGDYEVQSLLGSGGMGEVLSRARPPAGSGCGHQSIAQFFSLPILSGCGVSSRRRGRQRR